MGLTRARIIQFVSILIVEATALYIVANFSPNIAINSGWAALVIALVVGVVQAVFWWLFIHFLGRLPVILYPIITFVFAGALVSWIGNKVPGIVINGFGGGLVIILTITIVSAILGALLSLDEDASFDRNVTRKMVQRYGKPFSTDTPGFLFLEIDGLCETAFRRAIADGLMPTVKRWLDNGEDKIIGWETDFTSQTGAMQTGILLGSNDDIPAYRWWDRTKGRIVMSGKPFDARDIEARLSTGKGLLSDGGASRGNMFSGDAAESILTFSTLLDPSRGRGPGFYLYLVSPFVIFRLLTRYFIEVVKEIWQQGAQKRRKDKYIVSARNIPYAFFRGVMGPILQDFTTYAVISDIMRGVPAVYALYAGYDDVAHFAGMTTPDALEMLTEIDHYFARIERALAEAPRPYYLIVLSDHGQSSGAVFKTAHGLSLEELVKGLIKGDEEVYAAIDTNEAWDNINAFLSESVNANTRTAGVARQIMASKMQDGVVSTGPERDAKEVSKEDTRISNAKVVVVGSGCTGLINFKDATERMTYEQIQDAYPDLILGLAQHPGIGWVMVKSETNGTMIIGKRGINFIDVGTFEGTVDPLAVYGPNAAAHLRRESSFSNCPDLVVNTTYDPETQELCGFENQASHHGGLGGPQNHGFILYPSGLPYDGQPVVGAEGVYKLLRGWRVTIQGLEATETTAAAPGAL